MGRCRRRLVRLTTQSDGSQSHAPPLWRLGSLLYYCCQSMVDYRFQHASSGAATVDPDQRFDTAIQSGITAASGQ
eukprot:5920925-Prymnesium_polylepis.1